MGYYWAIYTWMRLQKMSLRITYWVKKCYNRLWQASWRVERDSYIQNILDQSNFFFISLFKVLLIFGLFGLLNRNQSSRLTDSNSIDYRPTDFKSLIGQVDLLTTMILVLKYILIHLNCSQLNFHFKIISI